MNNQGSRQHVHNYLCTQFSLKVEQVDSLLPNFIATLATHLANVEQAEVGGELINLSKAAHTMKGALLNLGLTEAAELAQQIEIHGRDNDRAVDYAALVAELRSNLADLFP